MNWSKENWLGKLARGEYGLSKTFWIYGVLGIPVVGFMAAYLIGFFPFVPLVLFLYVVVYGYQIVVCFGMWNAATVYKRVAKQPWLADITKVIVVLGAVGLVLRVVRVISLVA